MATAMIEVKFFSDPSHGWLRVPLREVKGSGIYISSYSYMDGEYAYLEEDLDATTFIRHFGKDNLKFLDEEFVNHESPIRDLQRFPKSV